MQSHGQLFPWHGIKLWPISGIGLASRLQFVSEIVKSNSLTRFLRSGYAAGRYLSRLKEVCWYLSVLFVPHGILMVLEVRHCYHNSFAPKIVIITT